MQKHDDWFDDFITMKLAEESEEENPSDAPGSYPPGNSGCLPVITVILAILAILKLFQ